MIDNTSCALSFLKYLKGLIVQRFQFSNFYPCDIEYGGMVFPTPENLYQALKTKDKELREEFTRMSPVEAKRRGRMLEVRDDWEEIKVPAMTLIQERRFQNPFWASKLKDTEGEIVEYNYWHDNFWGMCTCKKCDGQGRNELGKIIMKIRGSLV
jgi:ribA/ribD-fused uncharacterized protein